MTTRDAAQTLTRAEKIRLQRVAIDRKRDKEFTENKPRMQAETPSVILRGNVGTPVAQRLQQPNVRRKYSVPMGKSGAELVVPGIPEIKTGWRLLSGLIFATMIFMLFSFSANSNFRIKQAAVSGNNRISAVDMNLILDVANKPIFMLDLYDIKNTLATAYPELSTIEVSIAMPDQLLISVVERNPVVAWQMESQTLWIDSEGVVFQSRGDLVPQVVIQSHSLPPVLAEKLEQTDSTAQLLPSQLVQKNHLSNDIYIHVLDQPLLEAAKTLKEHLSEGSALVYTAEHGLGWQAEQGWKTFVGFDLSNIDAKMSMYDSIVEYLSTQEITPGMVSIEYIHAPYYRMERNE
ncbi:MAG: FtsQ-type POTRA domain-containing protein [Anaerolineaceae bacterium]|nr:FtsQ-type POTRA domain-containing protein [Anaerolineaceae bacterium]